MTKITTRNLRTYKTFALHGLRPSFSWAADLKCVVSIPSPNLMCEARPARSRGGAAVDARQTRGLLYAAPLGPRHTPSNRHHGPDIRRWMYSWRRRHRATHTCQYDRKITGKSTRKFLIFPLFFHEWNIDLILALRNF